MNAKPNPKDQSERQLRVFISSTFRDMQADRNHLVTMVFPQLRRLCEARGVTWGEVDLRWGVTDEAAAEGQVLPICLEEINRSRPYFIALLGERYGWVPQTIPEALLQQEAWLRQHLQEHKSVTELEILHGVLRDPAMASHAFFYFRDPQYVNTIPEQNRVDFTAENPEDAERLRNLKRRIRESGLPLRDNYADPKALGELVLADLTAVINQHWPEGSQPDPLTREQLEHAAYARSRERVYIGRPEYFGRLNAYICDASTPSSPPTKAGALVRDEVRQGRKPLVILGESGSGKSALLANWAAYYRREHPDAFILEHYIGATPASSDWAAMLRRILGEFKKRLGLQQAIPEHPDALRSAFPNWLHMAAAALTSSPVPVDSENVTDRPGKGSGPIILILDALNQLEDRDGAPDLTWLPSVMPENVCLIVSTLPGRALDEITRRQWTVLQVELLSVAERKELVRLFLRDYARTLSPTRVDRIATASQSGNPLYLRVLLDELRLFGRHELLDERIDYYLQAASPYELYGKVIARWQENHGQDLVRDTLSLLWAARRGVSESELLDALGRPGQPLPRARWSPLFLAMADAVASRSGLLTFAHDFLRRAVRDAYLPTDAHRQQAHIRLADYFEAQPAGVRRTDELPWQLAQARAWQRLQDLLVDRRFFTMAWTRSRFELSAYWTQIESASSLRMIQAYPPQVEHAEIEGDTEYLWNVSTLLANAGHHGEALRLCSSLAVRLNTEDDQINLAGVFGKQASILHSRGDLDGSMVLFKKAERICRQVGHLESLGHNLNNQALVLKDRGDPDGAMALLEESARIYLQLGDQCGLGLTLGNKANFLFDRGDFDGAMALRKQEERICHQSGDERGLSQCLCAQANILAARNDAQGAIALQKEAERMCRELGDLDGLSLVLLNQAGMMLDKEPGQAMKLLEETERICRRLGHVERLASTLAAQAVASESLGRGDDAVGLLKEAQNLADSHGYAHLAGTLKIAKRRLRALNILKYFAPGAGVANPPADDAVREAAFEGALKAALAAVCLGCTLCLRVVFDLVHPPERLKFFLLVILFVLSWTGILDYVASLKKWQRAMGNDSKIQRHTRIAVISAWVAVCAYGASFFCDFLQKTKQSLPLAPLVAGAACCMLFSAAVSLSLIRYTAQTCSFDSIVRSVAVVRRALFAALALLPMCQLAWRILPDGPPWLGEALSSTVFCMAMGFYVQMLFRLSWSMEERAGRGTV